METKLSKDNLIFSLEQFIPEFSSSIVEHRKEYGHILEHVLFGDFTRFVIQEYKLGHSNVYLRCINFIEDMLNSNDGYLVEVAQASFLENLYQANDGIKEISKSFSKRTKVILRKIYPNMKFE
jgi:hypothetical protein